MSLRGICGQSVLRRRQSQQSGACSIASNSFEDVHPADWSENATTEMHKTAMSQGSLLAAYIHARNHSQPRKYQTKGGHRRNQFDHAIDCGPCLDSTIRQGERRLGALVIPPGKGRDMRDLLRGTKIDIICTETGDLFLKLVSKQMLIHFLGMPTVATYLLTRTDGSQALTVSAKHCDYIGLKLVIAWMQRACRLPGQTTELKVHPTGDSILVACSIARALRVFGCLDDLTRIEQSISHYYFDRSLRLEEIEELWCVLPHDCIYNKMLVANVRSTLTDITPDHEISDADFNELVNFVMGDSELRGLVYGTEQDVQENESPQDQDTEGDTEEEENESDDTVSDAGSAVSIIAARDEDEEWDENQVEGGLWLI
ncbi:hypothetical protein EJ04DRAFT_523906 [Polyplosphaeria fusca]|uniref:Uncharacterized protein n=1 Tax=Polyplosphaeria fusca TaxID=682080 RepID=A0A9P4QZU1_9PLEO|nr:hypothetical protein EJ04DRAFT_523906 [Polyplosphaeria fusca]